MRSFVVSRKAPLSVLVLWFVLVLPFVAVFAQEPRLSRPIEGRATNSPLWCKNIVLVYVSPAGAGADFWTKDNFEWLIAYRDLNGQCKDFFFDGFLILGFSCKGGRHLLAVTSRQPSIKSDWEDAITHYLTCAQKLSESFEDVDKKLNAADRKGKVILAVPYPDRRQKSFGSINGKNLNFTNEDDRLDAVKWYVDEAARKWNDLTKQGILNGVALVGFYWGNEGISDTDAQVVKDVASYVREKGYLMHWIPCFGGARRDWKELGLDCVTQQINYQNPQKPGRPLTIFDNNSRIVEEYAMHGVEMTPVARETHLNPRIWSWHQVILANLEAALRLHWDKYSAMTYFSGNDIPEIAADPKTHIFYEDLYKWTKGKLTRQDLEQLSTVVLDEQKSRGLVNDATCAQIAKAKTVLEKLQLMEEPKLASLQKEAAERLAPYTKSSGNLLANGSFEKENEGWPVLSKGVTRADKKAYRGRWSLQLSPDPGNSGDILRTYAKSANVSVQPGQVVRLTAWVNVPDDLKETSRGLIIGLSRFDKGRMIAAWTDCEVRQLNATNGWETLSTCLFVDDMPCEEVQVIIGVCGAGVAYVDAVELVALDKP